MSDNIEEIMTVKRLKELAKFLRVRDSWHEPDEQDVNASVTGTVFDNDGFEDNMRVILSLKGKSIAKINLATLFAFACGTYEGDL